MSIRRKETKKNGARVMVLKQIGGHDPRIAALLREGAEELSRNGKVLTVLSQDDHGDTRGFVQVLGTYHRVVDNEWANTRFFKPTRRIERLFDGFFEEE
jgi:hypothetical protein